MSKALSFNWFDATIGPETTGLYNGKWYIEPYRLLDSGTKFFDSSEFQKGSVTYFGQEYFNADLKYDVYDDQLLLRTADNLGANTILLNKTQITAFTIAGHNFIKWENDLPNTANPGFYEIIYEHPSGLGLYKKHRKEKFSKIKKKNVYYRFKDGKDIFLLDYKAKRYSIKNTRQILKIMNVDRGDYKKIKGPLSKAQWASFLNGLLEKI